MKIYIVRHGQDEDNASGILNGHRNSPLTELGREQALQLSNKIIDAKISFDKILCSPLQRAAETAQIIAINLEHFEPEKWDLLIERDFGVMTGKPANEIAERCAPNIIETEKIIYFLTAEGAETFPDLILRAEKILAHLKEMNVHNILLVTHGDIGKMLYAVYYKRDWQEVLKKFYFGNSDLLLLSEDSDSEEFRIIAGK
jgi:probable phosphoglycerate mutase